MRFQRLKGMDLSLTIQYFINLKMEKNWVSILTTILSTRLWNFQSLFHLDTPLKSMEKVMAGVEELKYVGES